MKYIEINKVAWAPEGISMAGFAIKDITFKEFVEMATVALTIEGGQNVERNLLRERIKQQVAAHDTGKKEHAIDGLMLLTVPACYVSELQSSLDSDGTPGKIISGKEADGVSEPIVYQFGEPVEISEGVMLKEIEIQAKTYADVEDIIVADNILQQTYALLEKCSLPVGVDGNFLALPTAVLEKISITDGSVIAKLITPRFLG